MQEAIQTFFGVSEVYYAARILENKTKISSRINFRPYLKILGCEITESSTFFTNSENSERSQNFVDNNQQVFMRIEGPKKFSMTIPAECEPELERMLLAQGLGHFILHSQSGKYPCVIPTLHSSAVSTEGFWFALSLLIEKNSFLKAIQSNLSISELSHLFRVPEVAITSNLSIVKHLKDI